MHTHAKKRSKIDPFHKAKKTQIPGARDSGISEYCTPQCDVSLCNIRHQFRYHCTAGPGRLEKRENEKIRVAKNGRKTFQAHTHAHTRGGVQIQG